MVIQEKEKKRVRFASCSWEEEEARTRRGQKDRKERRRQKEQRDVEEYATDLRQIYKAYRLIKAKEKLETILSNLEEDESFRNCLTSFLRSIGAKEVDDLRSQIEWFQRDPRCFDELYELKSVPMLLYRLSSQTVFQPGSSLVANSSSLMVISKSILPPPPESATTILPPALATREPESFCTYVVVNDQVRATCNCGRHGPVASPELRAQNVVDAIYATTTASLVGAHQRLQDHLQELSYHSTLRRIPPPPCPNQDSGRKRSRSSYSEFDKPGSSSRKGMKVSSRA